MTNVSFDKQKLDDLCRHNNIRFLGIFGSGARNEMTNESDVDLLVKFESPKSLFELVRLEDQFSSVFKGRKIDLVTEGFLSPYFRDQVFSQTHTLYGLA